MPNTNLRPTPWYCHPFVGAEREISAAPTEIRPHLRDIVEDGFTVFRNAIASDLIEGARRGVANLKDRAQRFNPPLHYGKMRRVVNAHAACPELRSLFSGNVKTLETLDYLFGAPAALYTSLLYEIGSSQDLHRDTPYFWTNPGYRYFGVWVALEDVDLTNGCLQISRGSNRLPEEDVEDIRNCIYKEGEPLLSDDIRLWMAYQSRAQQAATHLSLPVLDMKVSAGDTIVWHPHTLHGGRPIEDFSRSRLSLVMHVTPENQAVHHQDKFFSPEAEVLELADREYIEFEGRKIANYPEISFEHALSIKIENLT